MKLVHSGLYQSLLDESISKPVTSLPFSYSYACKGCKHFSQQHPQSKTINSLNQYYIILHYTYHTHTSFINIVYPSHVLIVCVGNRGGILCACRLSIVCLNSEHRVRHAFWKYICSKAYQVTVINHKVTNAINCLGYVLSPGIALHL